MVTSAVFVINRNRGFGAEKEVVSAPSQPKHCIYLGPGLQLELHWILFRLNLYRTDVGFHLDSAWIGLRLDSLWITIGLDWISPTNHPLPVPKN